MQFHAYKTILCSCFDLFLVIGSYKYHSVRSRGHAKLGHKVISITAGVLCSCESGLFASYIYC